MTNMNRGQSNSNPPVYFKQYGAERTGTNYLKRLIELNFSNAVVFGSVLGWKHGLYETRNGPDPQCESHQQWLDQCTTGETVHSVDGHQLPFTQTELQESISKLNYLISTKDLRSWVYSFKQFRARQRPWSSDDVAAWCRRWVDAHGNWACLLESHGGALVEFEYLLRDITPTLEAIESRFRLIRKNREFGNEPRIVEASTDLGLLFSRMHFEPKPYQNREYLSAIPIEIHRTIEKFESGAQAQLRRLRSASEMRLVDYQSNLEPSSL